MKSFLADYTLKELKDVARKYKAVVNLSYSRMTKAELAEELHKHLEHDDKNQLRLRKKVGLLAGYHEVHKLTKPVADAKRAADKAGRKETREAAASKKKPKRRNSYEKSLMGMKRKEPEALSTRV
jgi:hypothetical protein